MVEEITIRTLNKSHLIFIWISWFHFIESCHTVKQKVIKLYFLVCGERHPKLGGNVEGIQHPHSDGVFPVHGFRPHREHHGPGQEKEHKVWLHFYGAGTGGSRPPSNLRLHARWLLGTPPELPSGTGLHGWVLGFCEFLPILNIYIFLFYMVRGTINWCTCKSEKLNCSFFWFPWIWIHVKSLCWWISNNTYPHQFWHKSVISILYVLWI